MVAEEVRRGRPRSAVADEAIDAAIRSLLIEVGYAALTIEAVAERAGVGRPTIYRRWPSKAHMVWDVLFSTPAGATVIGDTGDVRADVELWVRTTMEFFAQPVVARAFPGLLADGSVADAWHDHLRDPVRKQVLARLKRAVAEGQLRADLDLSVVFDTVTGLAIYRATVPQSSGRGPSLRAITDLIFNGALTAST